MTGEWVIEMRIDKLYDRYHAPYGVIHRADLLDRIHDACRGSNLIELLPSRKVVSIEDSGNGVTVRTEGGETYQGAALIGCDGLWSTVRQHIVGDGKPVVAGPHHLSRGAADRRGARTNTRLPKMIIWAGDKTHLVHYPLRRRRTVQPRRGVPFRPLRGRLGQLRRSGRAARALLGKVRAGAHAARSKVESWKMWVLCDRPPIKNWSKGRITLLGDAAHPMLQYLAQGACMAIEDAVCLANQIEATGGDYATAFRKYQELRYLRTARVQIMARVYGEVYHANNVVRELRNKVLREWLAQGGVDMSWLYGEQPELPHVDSVPQPETTRTRVLIDNRLQTTSTRRKPAHGET